MAAQRNGNGQLLTPLPVFMPNSQDPREAIPGSTPIWNGQPSSVQATPATSGASANTVSPEQWQKYIDTITQAMAKSAGFERDKLAAQRDDAQRALNNAYKITQLQSETSKYGYDQTRATQMAQLQENARQYDQNHDLEMQKFGLSQQEFGEGQRQFNANLGQRQQEFGVTSGQAQQNINLGFAKTATDYLSTPDRFFQAGDYIDMGKRALQGLGPQPYGATGTPVPKTTDEFAVLSGYTAPGEQQPVYAGGTPGFNEQGAGGQQQASGRGADMMNSGGNAANDPGAPDPRAKAVRGIFDAIPPSNEDGLNSNDWAALQAAKAIYSSNLKPGTLQRMRPGQLAMNRSAGTRLGYNPQDWEADVQNYGVGQGSSRAA